MAIYSINIKQVEKRRLNLSTEEIQNYKIFAFACGVLSGTIDVKARLKGKKSWELEDVGVYDFANPSIMQYKGSVSEWVFLVRGVSGISCLDISIEPDLVSEDMLVREGIALGGLYVIELEVG